MLEMLKDPKMQRYKMFLKVVLVVVLAGISLVMNMQRETSCHNEVSIYLFLPAITLFAQSAPCMNFGRVKKATGFNSFDILQRFYNTQ